MMIHDVYLVPVRNSTPAVAAVAVRGNRYDRRCGQGINRAYAAEAGRGADATGSGRPRGAPFRAVIPLPGPGRRRLERAGDVLQRRREHVLDVDLRRLSRILIESI